MTGARFRIAQAGLTDVGKIRQANEDSFVARPEAEFWAVADGMGGHKNGRWASETIAEVLGAAVLGGDFDNDAGEVSDAIHAANRRIFEAATASGQSMGSTVVALMMRADRFAAFWAGDSRLYLRREGELHRLTRDHTQVQEMVDKGYLAPADAATHPMSHVLSRAVGVERDLELAAITDEAQPGDVFMLCSDGLYGVMSDDEILQILASEPQAAARSLIDTCLARGAPDNVTVIVVACQEPTLLSLQPGGSAR